MELEKDENIILDDGPLGFRRKLTLTNKRLIIQKGEGLFRVTWKQESEIPLAEIEEAYLVADSFSALSSIKLRMKNGESVDLQLKLGDTQALGASLAADTLTDMAVRMKILNDRWISAINNRLRK